MKSPRHKRNCGCTNSFEGLPAPTKEDVLIDDIFGLGSMDKYQGTMSCPEDMVRARLGEINFPADRYVVVRGFFANSPNTPGPKSISFAYIDFDFYRPILDALEFIEPRMPVGGRVVIDDYGWFSDGAQKAVDEFITSRKSGWKFGLPHPFAGKFALLEKTV